MQDKSFKERTFIFKENAQPTKGGKSRRKITALRKDSEKFRAEVAPKNSSAESVLLDGLPASTGDKFKNNKKRG